MTAVAAYVVLVVVQPALGLGEVRADLGGPVKPAVRPSAARTPRERPARAANP